MIEVTFEKVPGGFLMNGSFFLRDYFDTPESQACITETAKRWADAIDADIAARVYGELRLQSPDPVCDTESRHD